MNSHPEVHSTTTSTHPNAPPLLDRLRMAACERGDSKATAETLVSWTRAFIHFHKRRHPSELGLREVTQFLEHLVKTVAEPLPALALARSGPMLLYNDVLGINLGELPQPRPPRLLDQLRLVLRVRYYSPRTEDCYVQWARRFIVFHHKRHPRSMSAAEVEEFLTHLATAEHVSSSTQNPASSAPSRRAMEEEWDCRVKLPEARGRIDQRVEFELDFA